MVKHRYSRDRKKAHQHDSSNGKSAAANRARLIMQGREAYQAGDLTSARKIFLKVISKDAGNAEALYSLSCIAHDRKLYADAIEYLGKLRELHPDHRPGLFLLGSAYISTKSYGEAAEIYQVTVKMNPNDAEGWYNLGFVAGAQNNLDEAVAYYEKALSLNDRYTDASYNIGCIRLTQHRYEEAEQWFQKTIDLAASYAAAWFNRGYIALEQKRYDDAVRWYEKTISLEPGNSAALTNLGLVHHYCNRLDQALSLFRKAIEINPSAADAYLNMGNTYRQRGELEKATECYQKSIDIQESLVGLTNLCGLQKELCLFEEAEKLSEKILNYEDLKKADLATLHDTCIQICAWDKARALIERFRIAPDDLKGKDVLAGSFMEFCATTDLTLDEISDLHRQWGTFTEAEVGAYEHPKERRHHQRIRIGYVSPDLHEHSVGYLIKDIITSHNYCDFDVYCYANFNPKDADAFTQEIIDSCTVFKYIYDLSDQEVAEEIYRDEVDILIDLAGHTAGHRLRAMARKPAPVQMTYLGYPHTTGLSRIDYRITDQYAECDHKDYRYAEKLLRLTHCFLTFKGFEGLSPAEIRDVQMNDIRFGCFNNIQKLTPQAVSLWAAILRQVEGSRLLLKAKQLNTPLVWNNIVREFGRHGIAEQRLVCLGYTVTREDHLRLYDSIDVALDTFPYNGTVTTLEALWMNVPVITLVGESHAQRVGFSILKNLDLDPLIAYSDEEYVDAAVALARSPEQIKELKTRMRRNLLASSICNPRVFTRELEVHLKKIWADYGKEASLEMPADARSSQTGDSMDLVIRGMSMLRMAMVKLEAGEPEKALEISLRLIDTTGIASLAWYVAGVAYQKLGRSEEAIASLKHSLSLNDRNPGAWKLLGEMHLQKNEYDDARICLEQGTTAERRHLDLT
nr:tetratricopeptide repeat protein [Deltaproteobacteria bacterium]